MRKIVLVVVLALVSLVLSACRITVIGPSPDDRFVLNRAVFSTSYEYQGHSVVCDDRSTQFDYSVSYRGDVDHAVVYLVGDESGRRYNARSFSIGEDENRNGNFSGSFSVGSEVVPLSTSIAGGVNEQGIESFDTHGKVSSQAIVVVPRDPEIIGYTILYIDLETDSGFRAFNSNPIPVLDFCG